MYAIDSSLSFDHLCAWIDEFPQSISSTTSFILVGNKIDLEETQNTTQEKAVSYSSTHNFTYVESSLNHIDDLIHIITTNHKSLIFPDDFDLNESALETISRLRVNSKTAQLSAVSNLRPIVEKIGPSNTLDYLYPYILDSGLMNAALNRFIRKLPLAFDSIDGVNNIDKILSLIHRIASNNRRKLVFNNLSASAYDIFKKLPHEILNSKFFDFIETFLNDGLVTLVVNITYKTFSLLPERYNELINIIKKSKDVETTEKSGKEEIITKMYLILKDVKYEPNDLYELIEYFLSKDAISRNVLESIPQILSVLNTNQELCEKFYLKVFEKAQIFSEEDGTKVFLGLIPSVYQSLLENVFKVFTKSLPIKFIRVLTIQYAQTKFAMDEEKFHVFSKLPILLQIGACDETEASELIQQNLGKGNKEMDKEIIRCILSTGVCIDSIMSKVNSIIDECDWRMKNQIIDFIIKKSNDISFEEFNNDFKDTVFCLLNDKIAIVRTHAANSLAEITKIFGTDEMLKSFENKIREMYKSLDYHIREIALIAIVKIDALDNLKDIVEDVVKDPVSNVRLMLARLLDKSQKSYLELLENDDDMDVRNIIGSKIRPD